MDGLLVQGSKQRFQQSFRKPKYIKDNLKLKQPLSGPISPASTAHGAREQIQLDQSVPTTAMRKLVPVTNP